MFQRHHEVTRGGSRVPRPEVGLGQEHKQPESPTAHAGLGHHHRMVRVGGRDVAGDHQVQRNKWTHAGPRRTWVRRRSWYWQGIFIMVSGLSDSRFLWERALVVDDSHLPQSTRSLAGCPLPARKSHARLQKSVFHVMSVCSQIVVEFSLWVEVVILLLSLLSPPVRSSTPPPGTTRAMAISPLQ